MGKDSYLKMLTRTGLLTVLPTSAMLLVNDYTSETQPFMVFDYGNQRMGTVTNQSIGKTPVWKDELQFMIHGDLDTIKITMCDRLAAHGKADMNLFIESEIDLKKMCGSAGTSSKESYSNWYDLTRDGVHVGVVHISFKFQEHTLSPEELSLKDHEMVHEYDYLFVQMHWHKDWLAKLAETPHQGGLGVFGQVTEEYILQRLGQAFKECKTLGAIVELCGKAMPCDRWGGDVSFWIDFDFGSWNDTKFRITLFQNGTFESSDQYVYSRDDHSDNRKFGCYWVDGDEVNFEGFHTHKTAGWTYSECFTEKLSPNKFHFTIDSENNLVIPDGGQVCDFYPESFPVTLENITKNSNKCTLR